MPNEYSDKINVVKYRGDIDSFLNMYSKMEYMICIKFHAMILSTLFRQRKFVISYLSKLSNVNEDLKLTNNFIDMNDVTSNTFLETSDFDIISDDKLKEYVELSKQQYDKLDEYVKSIEVN